MFFLVFVISNVSICLSPPSSFELNNQELISQILESKEVYLQKKEEAFSRIPDWAKTAGKCLEKLEYSGAKRIFVTLSELTIPSLLSQSEQQDIIDYVSYHYSARQLENPKKIAIVGAGPIGLIVAIEFSLAGHHVTVIEKRSSYTRDRLFSYFNYGAYPFLEHFFPHHIRAYFHKAKVCIKHVEEALKCVLKGVQLVNPHVKFEYGKFKRVQYRDEIIQVFYEQKNHEESLGVDCLFGCDGAHSKVRSVAQNNGVYSVTKDLNKGKSVSNENFVMDTVFFRLSQRQLLQNKDFNQKEEKVMSGHSIYESSQYEFLYKIGISKSSGAFPINKDFLPFNPKSETLCQIPLQHFSQEDTEKFKFIPISLYTESYPSLFNHSHGKNDKLEENRIYLFGESLVQFPLGSSFYVNLLLFYQSLPQILTYLSTNDWGSLTHLCQVGQLFRSSIQFDVSSPYIFSHEKTEESDFQLSAQVLSEYKKLLNLPYMNKERRCQILKDYLSVYLVNLKLYMEVDCIELFLQIYLTQGRYDLINEFFFQIAHFCLENMNIAQVQFFLYHLTNKRTKYNCEVANQYTPLLKTMIENKTEICESTFEEIVNMDINEELDLLYQKIDNSIRPSYTQKFCLSSPSILKISEQENQKLISQILESKEVYLQKKGGGVPALYN